MRSAEPITDGLSPDSSLISEPALVKWLWNVENVIPWIS
jgi:hypothetical protein